MYPFAYSADQDPFRFVAPIGSFDPANPKAGNDKAAGRCRIKPWEYPVTVAIPHLNTFETLLACIALHRAQSVPPYIVVVDTGSPPSVRAMLEALRAEDLEIHYIASNGYRHSSEPVCVALDLAQSICRTPLLFHTHADCFPRRRDLLEAWARLTNANTPAVGYRMSCRDKTVCGEHGTDEWQWMVGHSALMLYMPSIHRAGATWSFQRIRSDYGYHFHGCGWPDTETGFNHGLRNAGIVPAFLGYERNHERQIDDNLDHVRSFTGQKIYGAGEYHGPVSSQMPEAIEAAYARATAWAGLTSS